MQERRLVGIGGGGVGGGGVCTTNATLPAACNPSHSHSSLHNIANHLHLRSTIPPPGLSNRPTYTPPQQPDHQWIQSEPQRQSNATVVPETHSFSTD